MFVLNTDHLSLLDRESGPAASRLANRLAGVAAEGIGTTIVNFEEQMRGWLAYLAQARTIKQQIQAYGRLGRRIGTMDLKIAAIVLSKGDTLLSRNLSDFERISGLKVEDWTS